MREFDDHYEEEYVYLADMTDTAALVSWGKFPALTTSAPLTFAVIGDTGTGTSDQAALANALDAVIKPRGVRFVLMTGDTVYRKSGGSGDDDDEWLMTYFQPYRTLIDCVPFFPCVGNHDTSETLFEGGQGDTLTLYDNLLVTARFQDARPGRDASIAKGLFYRFRFGSDVEFICVDTSKDKFLFGKRMFQKDPARMWLRNALASPLGSPTWRVPFSHHPPYCAGPQHGDTDSMREEIVPRCAANGVRAFISGHEHNFQCIDSEDASRQVRCVVTGGGGTWRDGQPEKATNGHVNCWGGNQGTHFLVVSIAGPAMTIEPITAAGTPLPLSDRENRPFPGPIRVTR